MKKLIYTCVLALVLTAFAGCGAQLQIPDPEDWIAPTQNKEDTPTQPVTVPAEVPGEETEETDPPVTDPVEVPGAETTQPEFLPAPDFTVYDADGNPVKLSDFQGKPVVLNFWASWCGPCKAEMPDFQQMYEKLGDRVQFLVVNLTDGRQETVETASAYIQSKGYTFPVYYDTTSAAAAAYGIYSIPTTYFIDANGAMVCYANSMLSASALQQGIDMICE